MKKIRLAIAGYGNLGKATLKNLASFPDMEAVALISRRPLDVGLPTYSYDEAHNLKGKVDVVIMCGGSAHDLPVQSPLIAQSFCLVDSFDTHARILEHIQNVESSANKGNTLAAVSVGWDPGLFSLSRALFSAVLPSSESSTFWGRGVSQGHSDAIRRVEGVKNGVQYTIPKTEAINAVKIGKGATLSTRQKHLRECFVVPLDGADTKKIEQDIKSMPNYFADYDTVVHFITEDELKANHSTLPHGGFVINSGNTASQNRHVLEFSLKLDSNPEFTASVMLAYARAVYRLHTEGKTGCLTVLDIPYSYLTEADRTTLIKTIL